MSKSQGRFSASDYPSLKEIIVPNYDDEPTFPEIPLPLLTRLEEMCPDRAPDLEVPDRKVWFSSGQAHLVRQLRQHFNKQNERTMKRRR